MAANLDLAERIQAHGWFHTIDLGDGLVTKGYPPSKIIDQAFPDVRGKTVLDIGAWDGKYSFQAEQSGARRVVALDHYVWRLDGRARAAYYQQCEAEGRLPDPQLVDRGFLLDSLPGKTGFDMVHEYLDSKVEAVVDDFTTMDLSTLGTFDVVLYFGVLYHMVDPIGALRRVRQVTAALAAIETASVIVPGYEAHSLTAFFAGNELHADYGNWFVPSLPALLGMCRAAGFRGAELKATTRPPTAASPVASARDRWRRPWSPAPPDEPPQPVNTRLVVHAYV